MGLWGLTWFIGGPDGFSIWRISWQTPLNEFSLLLPAITACSTLVLEGRTPLSIRPYFFVATLITLEKKGGGVTPTAVGGTLRCLATKRAGNVVAEDMIDINKQNNQK